MVKGMGLEKKPQSRLWLYRGRTKLAEVTPMAGGSGSDEVGSAVSLSQVPYCYVDSF